MSEVINEEKVSAEDVKGGKKESKKAKENKKAESFLLLFPG